MTAPVRPKAIVFDVNETLLDLSRLQREFTQTFNEQFAFKFWFSTLLQYSLVDTLTTNYHDFGQIGKATLTMTSAYFDKPLLPDEQQTQADTTRQYSRLTATPRRGAGPCPTKRSRVSTGHADQFAD